MFAGTTSTLGPVLMFVGVTLLVTAVVGGLGWVAYSFGQLRAQLLCCEGKLGDDDQAPAEDQGPTTTQP